MPKLFLKSTVLVLITALLALLPILLLAWMMESGEPGLFFATFTYVFSGQLFTEGWNRIHAGSALDQPTIGKWYFWFTVFLVVWFPYLSLVRRFCVRRSEVRHWVFTAGLTVLCVFLVCLLTIPFWWMVQYVRKMGWIPRRFLGLLYGVGGYAVVLWFWFQTVRLKKRERMENCDVEMSAL